MLVLLQHHRADQAHDGGVIGEDANDAGAAFDLLVEPLEQVGAPQLAPVAGREVATGQYVLPGSGHQLCRLGELAGQHGRHLIPLLLNGAAALLGEHRAQCSSHHLLLSLGYGLQEVPGEMDPAALPGAALKHAAHGFGQADVGIGDHQPHAREAALFEATEELTPEGLAFAVAHLEPQQLTAAVTVDAHGHDNGPGADLQRFAEASVQVRRVEIEVRVAAAIQRALQERLDLCIEPLANAAHLRARDACLRADGGHQGVDLARRDALDPGFHDHRVERLIDTAPGLENRREERPRAEFGDCERDVAHLGGQGAGATAVAVAEPLVGALVAISAEHGGNLKLNQLLQAVAHQFRDELPSCAAIE